MATPPPPPGFSPALGMSHRVTIELVWLISLHKTLYFHSQPRYCMGVGYPVDLVVCSALGVDMFDCVYPCRTARFGMCSCLAGSAAGVVGYKECAMAQGCRLMQLMAQGVESSGAAQHARNMVHGQGRDRGDGVGSQERSGGNHMNMCKSE